MSATAKPTPRRRQNAGLPMALFTQGYRKTPIEQLYHDAHFDDFAQLRGIIDRLAPLPE